jgi:multidrug efflux pump subunit AcrA (membrane-fusion protein)
MSGDDQHDEQAPSTDQGRGTRMILLIIAGAYVLLSGWLLIDSYSRISKLEQQQKTTAQELNKEIAAVRADAKGSADALAEKIGMTEKDLSTRSAQLSKQQRAAEERLAAQQKEQISAVSGEVAGVKTEVGGVRTDVASTKQDLEATKAKLDRAMGDMNVMSGLIAHNRDDLEVLKHRGDRNYFEFTLLRGKSPTPISTVSLQLKKVDAKRGKFTLNVTADDRTLEKKDRLMNEPLQFYSGKDRQLYELVVFEVEKNKVSGYLSTPKTLAQAQPPAKP